MKRDGLLNPQLNQAIARLGHTDTFAICDCGLPLPPQARIIDLTLIHGVPSFEQVAEAILKEVVIEKVTIATQTPDVIINTLPADAPITKIDHEDFKKQMTALSSFALVLPRLMQTRFITVESRFNSFEELL